MDFYFEITHLADQASKVIEPKYPCTLVSMSQGLVDDITSWLLTYVANVDSKYRLKDSKQTFILVKYNFQMAKSKKQTNREN